MQKIIQISADSTEDDWSLFALTEDGEVYGGYFSEKLKRFVWRRVNLPEEPQKDVEN